MTKQIQLTRGMFALVDDEDYDMLMQYKWQAVTNHKAIYAQASFQRKTLMMHRIVIGAKSGETVDHINGDGLDNQRANLRICTVAENTRRRINGAPNKTGYKGVTFRRGKYEANIKVNDKTFFLGKYGTAEEAAHAYDEGAKKYHGDFASLNFS